MKLRSKEPFWLLKNGLISSYPSLRKNSSCEILIVGGGITGALMAYQLSKEGYNTLLIDKRDISTGSTSATTAMLQYEIDEPLYSLIDKVGAEIAIESYQEGVASIETLGKLIADLKIDCGFKKKNSLYIAHNQKAKTWLKKEYETRLRHGFKVSWVNKTQLKKDYGIVGEGGILSASGASVDAYSLAHGLISHSIKKYILRVYDHTAVQNVDYNSRQAIVTTEDGYVIKAKRIVYATGFETQSFVKEKIVDLISTYAFVSEPIPALPTAVRSTIFWNTQEPYLYFRTTDDNRILVGGGDRQFKNPEKRDRLIEKTEARLLKSIEELFPRLTLIPDFSWAGTFGVTRDALPYIGSHPDFPHSFFVLGFGGNGITFSVMGMQIISDALAGRHNKFLHYFRFGR